MHHYSFLTSPTPAQVQRIISLYCEQDWWDSPETDNQYMIERIVAGSHAFLIACEQEDIIGMGRAISDRVSDAYIQDVVVKTTCRGKGVGSEIITRLVARLHADGLHWIGLIAEQNSHPFYKQLGFDTMPNAQPMINLL